LEFYNKGQYVEAYAVFERITKIQPGDARVQKYMSQLKNEIAAGYYNAGNNSYNANRFDQAIAYWNNAKKWGADAHTIDCLIKNARDAKETYIRIKQEQKIIETRRAEQAAIQAQEDAKKAEEAATIAEQKKEEEEQIETVDVIDTIPGSVPGSVPGSGTGVVPGVPGATGTGTASGNGPAAREGSEALPTIGGSMTRVSAEASAASRAKYIEGLDAFNQDDYERARNAWNVAKQLDPGNTDAELGLRKIEELLK